MAGRIALVVGHSSTAQGAAGVAPLNQSEFEYNSDIAARAQQYGLSLRSAVLVDVVYRPVPGYQGIRQAYEEVLSYEPDCAIELHFNAFNGNVRGTECLVSSVDDTVDNFELELANQMQASMMNVFGRRGRSDRGVKQRPRTTRERGWRNVNQTSIIPSILLEPFFGDNEAEATAADQKRQEYAEMLVDTFIVWRRATGINFGLV